MADIRAMTWAEMNQTKYGDIYLIHFMAKQKKLSKWFKILTLVFSSGGIFSWSIWQNGTMAVIACSIIATMQIVSLVENQFLYSNEALERVAELRNDYNSQFNKLEELWLKIDKISDHETTDLFYKLRKIGEAIEARDNKLDIREYKSLCKISHIETTNYFSQYHSV